MFIKQSGIHAQFNFNILIALSVFLLSWIIGRGVFLVTLGSEDDLVQAIADDGLYYWLIARNLVEHGVSSFDGGQTLTSGYHPLWAWLLMPMTALPVSEIMQLRIFVAFSIIITAIAAIMILTIIIQRRMISSLIALCIMMGSYSWMTNSIAGLEWPLVVLINVVVFWIVYEEKPKYVFLFFLGVLGTLARSDFGAVPGIIVGVSIYLTWRSSDRNWTIVKNMTSVLGGAIVGLLVMFAYFYVMTGFSFQGSAAVKHLWAVNAPIRMQSAGFQFFRAFLYISTPPVGLTLWIHQNILWITIGTIGLISSIIFIFAKRASELVTVLRGGYQQANIALRTSVLASFGIVIFYLLLYGIKVVEVQPWYTAQVTIPLLICSSVFVWGITKKSNLLNLRFGSSFFVPLISIVLIFNTAANILHPWAFPAQNYMRDVGYIYKDKFQNQIVGFSGAGVVAFFQGGRIINLDGLVNNEILSYMPNRLPCYLLHKKIKIFDGFGASNTFFNLTNFTEYAKTLSFMSKSGQQVTLYESDFNRISQMPECK